jgi:hypothetical protein
MSTVSNCILELLNDDVVSHGLFVQCVEQDKGGNSGPQLEWKAALEQILLLGRVEIGAAKLTSADYVEFIAWKGTVGERIARASDTVDSVSGPDQEFAYWLCLRENIDRFEGEE